MTHEEGYKPTHYQYNRGDHGDFRPWGMDVRQFCQLMHLSQLLGFLFPLAGWVLPIVMWATNNSESEEVDRHGKEILNWIISMILYSFIAFLLTFVLIGIFLFIALGLLGVIFPIIAAVQAGNGQFWRYPMNIRFVN